MTRKQRVEILAGHLLSQAFSGDFKQHQIMSAIKAADAFIEEMDRLYPDDDRENAKSFGIAW